MVRGRLTPPMIVAIEVEYRASKIEIIAIKGVKTINILNRTKAIAVRIVFKVPLWEVFFGGSCILEESI